MRTIRVNDDGFAEAVKMIGNLPEAEYRRRSKIAAAWSRHVNNERERHPELLAHYAGDLVHDGFALGTADVVGPVVGVLRDFGADLLFEPLRCSAMAKVNPPSDKVFWFLYNAEGTTNGWAGSFDPCTTDEALAVFDAAEEGSYATI